MSRCYCTEIRKCTNDIRKLNQNLLAVDQCKNAFDELLDCLEQVKSYTAETFDMADPSGLDHGIEELDDDLKSARDEIRDKIDAKIKELKSKLSEMEEEDETYHKEEEEKENG